MMWYFIGGVIFASLFWFWFVVNIVVAVWQNGVTEGYGYAREKWNPGYRKAGYFLKNRMSHRWAELENE